MKKICLIIPYFGKKFPSYFPYFIKSAAWNDTIDFVFFTDIRFPHYSQSYKNIKFINFNLDDFNALASEKIGIPIEVKEPYKLCDFKPSYGNIFEDYLKEYDFWGHCDIDVIFGNIRNFITDEILTEYDIVSVRKEYLSGFFTLYKNNYTITRLYKRSKDWQKIYSTNKHFAFDEMNFLVIERFRGFRMDELSPEIECMTAIVEKNTDNVKVRFETVCHEFLYSIIDETGEERRDSLIISKAGAFSPKRDKEFCLVHLINLKSNSYFKISKINWNVSEILIDRTGIYLSESGKKKEVHRTLKRPLTLNPTLVIEPNHTLILPNSGHRINMISWLLFLPYFRGKVVSGKDIMHACLHNNVTMKDLRENVIDLVTDGVDQNLLIEAR